MCIILALWPSFQGHQRSLKVTFSLNLTVLLIQELVNTLVILNILVGTDKQCMVCRGQGVTFKGHCKVKGQVRDHMALWPLYAKLLTRAMQCSSLNTPICYLLVITASFIFVLRYFYLEIIGHFSKASKMIKDVGFEYYQWLSCFLLCLGLYVMFKRSPEVIKSHFFPELHPITYTLTCAWCSAWILNQ